MQELPNECVPLIFTSGPKQFSSPPYTRGGFARTPFARLFSNVAAWGYTG